MVEKMPSVSIRLGRSPRQMPTLSSGSGSRPPPAWLCTQWHACSGRREALLGSADKVAERRGISHRQ